MQIKSLNLNLKDFDMGKREAVLQHAKYKNLDLDKDRSNRGMFDKSWKENSGIIRFFFNHKKDQAPGKPMQFWDDDDGAYTRVKLGTHTLGEDTLKMLDEGIIQAVSFGFNPVKQKKIKDKGYDLLEVQHLETSVLTHWGANLEAKVISVTKEASTEEIKKLQESIIRMES